MTLFETVVTIGFTSVLGGIGYLYKDKKKADADHSDAIIARLTKEVERQEKQIESLNKIITAEKAEKAAIIEGHDACLKKVHDLEVQVQKNNNEIQLLKLKNQ